MRRRTFGRVAVCLVVGAGINVAVAWGVLGLRGAYTPLQQEPGLRWPSAPLASWPAPTDRSVGVGPGWEQVTLMADRPDADGDIACMMIAARTGWPARSLAQEFLTERRYTPVRRWEEWRWSLEIPSGWNVHRRVPAALPLRPLPAGFAANTAVYGAVAWAALAGRGLVRRWVRRRRGRCEGCGYPMAGAGGAWTCPECGATRSSVRGGERAAERAR